MADKKITQLTNITGANLVDADEFVVVDISADETKAITLGELKEAFDSGSGFVRITGDTMTGDLSFGDNDKAIFGAGSDLQIYHDGSNSRIQDTATGSLILAGTNFYVNNTGDSKSYLAGLDGGTTPYVRLYHDGVTRLDTTATGIDVTGTVTADGLTVGNGTQQARFYIDADEVSQLIDGNVRYDIWTGGDKTMRLDANGDISFYEDTGTTPKFFWDASAESLGIGTSSVTSGFKLDVVGDARFSDVAGDDGVELGWSAGGSAGFVQAYDRGASAFRDLKLNNAVTIDSSGNVNLTGLSNGTLNFAGGNTSGGSKIQAWNDAGNANGYLAIEGYSSEYMRIDSSGNLLVGTTDSSVYNNGSNTSADTGINLNTTYAGFARYNGTPMYVNRTGSDGDIIAFNKSGAAVGSIGAKSDDAYIGTGDTGVRFNDGNDQIWPVGASGASRDAAIDLGNSGVRFKDLYLSGVAYASELDVQGTTTTNGLNLDAISETISDTAVDVFVYDTSKDSDGGAWRKRTQGTSWYNETLNTATRGSRKEFPAVAVIVAEQGDVTIYDGDDPDLPMWMVFNAGADQMLRGSVNSSVSMLNGIMNVGSNIGGISGVNFVSDSSPYSITTPSTTYRYKGNISERNDALNYTTDSSLLIVNQVVNDVAMTVLPNAPIDAATGLPVPTIAVATDGGVSVIKDDGTVVDITSSSGFNGIQEIDFTDDNKLVYTMDSASNARAVRVDSIPAADFNVTSNQLVKGNGEEFYTGADFGYPAGDLNLNLPTANNVTKVVGSNLNDREIATTNGMTKIALANQSDPSTGMVAYTTSSYNTGWMNGNIKLATLSDTDATNVTGTQMLSNNTFDTDTTGWTPITANLSVSSGIIHVEQTSGSTGMAYQAVSTVVGKTYTIEGSFQTRTGSIYGGGFYVGTSAGAQDNVSLRTKISQGSFSPVSATFTATGSTTYISLISWGGTGDWIEFDYVNLRLAEEDRSVNGNGLQVFGTVTKSAVATGADLVAYSGFSDTNYLEQPYNSDLDFGTGDFCFTWWANVTSVPSYQAHFCRETPTFSGSSIEIFTESSSGYLRTYITDDGYTTFDVWNSNGIAYGRGWQHFASVRRGNVVSTYINGILDNNNTLVQAVGSLNNTSAKLFIGCQGNQSSPMNSGSIALFRASATAPSPEAIKRIYEDEKVLFQENAKAVLYGTSDAVTALAFDDTTNLLHVGTSAGRSVFQGLRRVDNTTTGVTTAISASNGLVVDQ